MGFKDLRTPDRWMASVTAVLLAGYFVFMVYTLAAPSVYDPQQGMATGLSRWHSCSCYLAALFGLASRATIRG